MGLQAFRTGFALAAITCGAVAASAQTSWTNAGTGNWFTPGNWTAGVPSDTTVVTTITNGGTAVINGGTAEAGNNVAGATLTIGNGSTLDLLSGNLNFETMVIQATGTFKAANDNWGGGCSTPCITLAGGTLHSAAGSNVYWDGVKLLANTTSTIKTDAGLAWEPGMSSQHQGLPTIIMFEPGSVLQIGGPGVVTYSGGASVTSSGTTELVILSGGTFKASNSQAVHPNNPLAPQGLHEITSVVTNTIVQSGGVLDFNLGNGNVPTTATINNLFGAGEVKTGLSTTVLSLGGGNFSGNISGGSDLKILSGGIVTLSGTNTYTGSTTVDGTLIVNGSIATSFLTTVNGTLSGGTLSTPGILGTTVIGGTLSPGAGSNSLGQLKTGALQFNAGSTYVVDVNAAGQNDKVAASGPATINGGTVSVLAAPGAYNPSTTYTIVTSTGVNGTFSGVTSNLAFLSPSLSYTSTDVLLTLARKAMFTSVALTPNQASTAVALDTLATNNPLFLALLGLTPSEARHAFDLLSGELYASLQSILIQDSQYVRQMLLWRMAAGSGAGSSVASSDAPYGLGMGAPTYRAAPAAWGSWAHLLGAWGKLEGDGNAATIERNLAGFFAGFDGPVGEFWRAGVAAGFTHSDVAVQSRLSSAGIDGGHLAAYASARWGILNVRLGSAFAWHDIDTSRLASFPGFSDSTRASFGAETAQVFGEVGLGMKLANIALEPFAGLTLVHVRTDGITEDGGLSALVVGNESMTTTNSTLGLRLASSYTLGDGWTLLPRASIAWQHAFGDVDPTVGVLFKSGSNPFVIAGTPLARDSALVDAGFDIAMGTQGRVGITYGGTWSESISDHSVKGSATWRF